MDTYPCPACGGVADETDGCRSCGRPPDPVAATLARLNQALAGLDTESRRLAEDQTELRHRREELLAQRQDLTRAIARRLAAETGAQSAVPTAGRPAAAQTGPAATGQAATGRAATGTTRPMPTRPAQARPTAPTQPIPGAPHQRTYASRAARPDQIPVGAETSPRGAQNTLLTLGGVLIGIAAIVAGVIYTSNTTGRAVFLAIATTVALAIPMLLARRTLTATAETIAGVGLLLVLLDGYAAYAADLAGTGSVSPPLYAAILFGIVAAVAAAYRLATHLRAPQFAALLAVQPFFPLIAVHLGVGRDGFAAVFALVAALNLGSVVFLRREVRFATTARLRPSATARTGEAWPRRLRELAWLMFGLTLTASVVLVLVAMRTATSVADAAGASLTLLFAAAVGVLAGRVSGRDRVRDIAAGGGALAIVVAVTNVDARALPDYTIVLTAAVAAAVAIAAGFLPERERRGPQLGALVGAALTAVVVIVEALQTAVTTVSAGTTPSVWHADLAGYAGRVHTTTWQIPVAAVLLTLLALAAVPKAWRADAGALGALVVVLAAPGSAAVPWWAIPLIGVLASAAAATAALYAPVGAAALIRSGTAGLLGVYAIGTSLARPGLTATVCALLAAVAGAIAVVTAGWPHRFGPYAHQVADAAGGAAAFTLPIAIGTFAWLGGAPSRVLLSLTLLTAALGTVGAALSQVAARTPRTGSAGGALAAAVGCLVLSLRLDGSTLADIGLAVLLLVAAGATAASRAFEVSGSGLLQGVRAVPAAVGALVDSLDNVADTPESERRARPVGTVDGMTIGAALATAAVILAMARLLAVAVPGIGLVTTTAMVLLVSLGVLLLPEPWRRGPRFGAGAVGGGLAVLTAAIAVTEAARAVAASTPFWSADLAGWTDRVSATAPYGWQVPASLALAAAAALVLVPAPAGGDVAYVALALAGLALPAALALAWWSAALIGFAFALVAGVGAALVEPGEAAVARRRLGLAAVLGLYATAAAGATAGSTALLLSAILAGGVVVATVAQLRGGVPPFVPGVAAAASLTAAPGAAATIAVQSGSSRVAVLGTALLLAGFGVVVVAALRIAAVGWGAFPAAGVAVSALVVALAALAGGQAQIWAAAAALVAVLAAATLRPPPRASLDDVVPPAEVGGPSATAQRAIVLGTAGPAALIAIIGSAPAWLTALVGPYRTLRQIWQGYAVAPEPAGAASAAATLAVLTAVTAAAAITLGGRGYVLAALLPPVAALALVTPAALGAPPGTTAWVALAVAAATGLGAALSPPVRPSATRLLRGTAGLVCAMTGAAGVAGSLATRPGTLGALGIVLVAAAVAAGLGRDPAVRMVAWIVASAAAFALPVTALAAADQPLRPGAFAVLAICGILVGLAWLQARGRRAGEASILELCALIGAALALLLALGSARHVAAVLTIWGLLLGAAALRPDRTPSRRQWLIRAALGAELGACWLLLYSAQVGLAEAYTLPFAAVALLAGALELRRRRDLSSWTAYGPALAGGFLPSLALVLVGQDPPWRWVTLFLAAIAVVVAGSVRRRRAPVVTGTAIAIGVALTEMVRLLIRGNIAGAVLVGVTGLVLVVLGAVAEQRLRGALRKMS